MKALKRFVPCLAMLLVATLAAAGSGSPAGAASSVSAAAAPAPGYWLIGDHGGVYNFGSASQLPGITGVSAPFVAAAATPTGKGLWLAASDGTIYTVGDAVSFGDLRGLHLNKPVVGMSATRTGKGYWMVAGDGGIFTFGDATFLGSLGSFKLNKPVVAMATTPFGLGYWMVAADGGIFTFGDARFFGSEGSVKLNKPVIGMAPTATGQGYWLVATDGGVFTHGDAPFAGSLGSFKLNKPINSMNPTSTNKGYWLIGEDGGVFTFGDAPFVGSLGSNPPSEKIVFLTPVPPAAGPAPTITGTSGPSISVQFGAPGFSGQLASFTDSDPTAQVAKVAVDWGDGVTSTPVVNGTPSAWTVSGSHAWSSPGKFNVTVAITDASGAYSQISGPANVGGAITVNVTHTAPQYLTERCPVGSPTLAASPAYGTPVCGTTALPLATFTDTNPATTTPSQFVATIDWHSADGTVADTTSLGVITAGPGAGQFTVSTALPTATACAAGAANTSACAFSYQDEGQWHPVVNVNEVGQTASFSPIGTSNVTSLYAIEQSTDTWSTAPGPYTVARPGTLTSQILGTFNDPGANDRDTSPWTSVKVTWGDGSSCTVTNVGQTPANQFVPIATSSGCATTDAVSITGSTNGTWQVIGTHAYTAIPAPPNSVTVAVQEAGINSVTNPAAQPPTSPAVIVN